MIKEIYFIYKVDETGSYIYDRDFNNMQQVSVYVRITKNQLYKYVDKSPEKGGLLINDLNQSFLIKTSKINFIKEEKPITFDDEFLDKMKQLQASINLN